MLWVLELEVEPGYGPITKSITGLRGDFGWGMCECLWLFAPESLHI